MSTSAWAYISLTVISASVYFGNVDCKVVIEARESFPTVYRISSFQTTLCILPYFVAKVSSFVFNRAAKAWMPLITTTKITYKFSVWLYRTN